MLGHDEKPLAGKHTPENGRKPQRNVYSSFLLLQRCPRAKERSKRREENYPKPKLLVLSIFRRIGHAWTTFYLGETRAKRSFEHEC